MSLNDLASIGPATFAGITFQNPLWLLLLPIILVPYIGDRRIRLTVPLASAASMVPTFLRRKPSLLRHGGWFLRTMTLGLIIFAMARPQVGRKPGKRSSEGIDIMMVVDTSGSMRARDFEVNGQRPDRLEVIKAVISEFIDARSDDRIGMVVFGSEAYTQAPLTLDHEVLTQFLEHVEIGMAGDGTAIGDGLATAVKRLKDTPGKSRVVILLTDGANNAGRIDPIAAAQAAKSLGIRVHTIGVGSEGVVPIVQNGRVLHIQADIDEKTLRGIADATGGQYWRAADANSLVSVYREIDKLEKVRRENKEQSSGRDVFSVLFLLAMVTMLSEFSWKITRYRRIPA